MDFTETLLFETGNFILFRILEVHAEIKTSNWVKLVSRLPAFEDSALFQSSIATYAILKFV